MENEEKGPRMSKFNRIIWYVMGGLSFLVVLVVLFAILRRGPGY